MRTDLIVDPCPRPATRGARWRGRSSTPITASGQYTSKTFARLGAEWDVTQSMGAVGTSADNALAESFNATLKRETLHEVRA
jgi:transposase InsO family protein